MQEKFARLTHGLKPVGLRLALWSIRWTTVDECLQDLNFLPQVAENGNPHDYYIPENIFYRLCMKAKNEVAPLRRKSDMVRYGVFDGQNRPAVMCLIRRMSDI